MIAQSGSNGQRPNSEVIASEPAERASRRRFTTAYKLAILKEVDAAKYPGHVGYILRREGLYYSSLRNFREQMAHLLADVTVNGRSTSGNGSAPIVIGAPSTDSGYTKRGRKPLSSELLKERVSQLERDKKRLQRRLEQAEGIIEIQKKLSEMLGISLRTDEAADQDEDKG